MEIHSITFGRPAHRHGSAIGIAGAPLARGHLVVIRVDQHREGIGVAEADVAYAALRPEDRARLERAALRGAVDLVP